MTDASQLVAITEWAQKRVEWVAAAVDGGVSRRKPAAFPKLKESCPLGSLAKRFGLGAEEVECVGLAAAIEATLELSIAVRALSGGALTVGLMRAALRLDEARVSDLLAPDSALRRGGWLVVGGVAGGAPSSSDVVVLAPGMAARLDGRAPNPATLGAGIERISSSPVATPVATPATGATGEVPNALGAVLRDQVLGGDRGVPSVALGGYGVGDAMLAAQVLSQRLRRDVLLVDGRTIERLGARDAWALLPALRRESFLWELPLVLSSAASLGVAFRLLLAPAPADCPMPLHTLFVDESKALAGQRHPLVRVLERVVAANSDGARSASAGNESPHSPPSPAPARAPTPYETEIDAARRKATRDAARAMGQTFDLSPEPVAAPAPPPPAAAVTTPPLAAAVTTPPLAAALTTPDAPSSAPVVVAPVVEESPQSTASVDARTPLSVDLAAPVPALAAAESGPADPDEELPYVEVPSSAAGADLIPYVTQACNPIQRAELLRRLSTQGRDLQIAGLLRAHIKVDHPKVRAAAEEGMARMFGPNWNKTRPIPKPVQHPRPDDE